MEHAGRCIVTSVRFLLPADWCHRTWRRRLLLVLAAAVSVSGPAPAADRRLEFLSALTDRGYCDTALDYLDRLETDPSLPDEVRTVLPLEKANVLLKLAETIRQPEQRASYRTQAEQQLRQFLQTHPQGHQAALARLRLGMLRLQAARARLWSGEVPEAGTDREAVLAEIRRMLAACRALFLDARDGFQEHLDTVPFVTEDEDPVGWEHRRQTEARLLRAWLSAGECFWEEARTWDPNAPQHDALLSDAVALFEEVETFGRPAAVLHARFMLGRCWQEAGDFSQALGYFDQVRTQPLDSVSVHMAEYCRLMCFNDESRADYELVVTEASRWLRSHPAQEQTEAGLGIRYEKAVALEALARRQPEGEERELRLRQALADFETVASVLSPVQRSAREAAERLRSELGETQPEPQDFDTAFERARIVVGRMQDVQQALASAASDEERQQLTERQKLLTDEAGRLFERALMLRTPDSDAAAVAQARYLLSYVFVRQRRPYEAFVLARYVMRHPAEDSTETAEHAAEMAIAAAVQAWSQAAESDRQFELNLIREICAEVVDRFPGTPLSATARLRLGRVYLDLGQPIQAAETFLQVAPDEEGYASARLEAGQAFWRAWIRTRSQADLDTTEGDSVQWKRQARALLEEGIRLKRDTLTDERLPDDVVRAEVSLCGLLNLEGEFQETIRRLTQISPTVMDAVQVDGERPERGVRSATFAGLCWRTLLRACIGARDIEAALQAMKQLEKLHAEDVAVVYMQLGRELQRELESLKNSGDEPRLRQVQSSFRSFLDQVYESRDPDRPGALLWIGETCAELADQEADAATAAELRHRAATVFEELLGSDPEPALRDAVLLRLLRMRRQQQQFRAAIRLAEDALANSPQSLSLQMEAARLLADWGEHDEPEYLLESISGRPPDSSDRTIWGWALLARRVQAGMRDRSKAERLLPLFLEARYELSRCRLRYARIVPETADRQLAAAAQEIMSLTQQFPDFDPEWRDRFEQLYQEIQTQRGQTSTALFAPASDTDLQNGDESSSSRSDVPDAAGSRPSDRRTADDAPAEDRVVWVLGGLAAGGAMFVIAALLLVGRRGRRRRPVGFRPPETFRLPSQPSAGSSNRSSAGRRPPRASSAAVRSTADKKRSTRAPDTKSSAKKKRRPEDDT